MRPQRPVNLNSNGDGAGDGATSSAGVQLSNRIQLQGRQVIIGCLIHSNIACARSRARETVTIHVRNTNDTKCTYHWTGFITARIIQVVVGVIQFTELPGAVSNLQNYNNCGGGKFKLEKRGVYSNLLKYILFCVPVVKF